MFITPSFKKSLIVEQFQGNYLKDRKLIAHTKARTRGAFCYARLTGQRPIGQTKENNRACSNGLDFPIRTRTRSTGIISKYWEMQGWVILNTDTQHSLPDQQITDMYMITCRPPPIITWKKNGQTIVTGDDFRIAASHQGRRLELLNVKKNIHEDTYTCEAENSQNSGNPRVFATTLTVKGM